MSNFQFFLGLLDGYKKYFKRPKVKVIDERDDLLARNQEAWAYYEPDSRTMFILREYDNRAVRAHEYGHWINACVYFLLEIAWEFIWWGCGFRSLVKNRGGKIRK